MRKKSEEILYQCLIYPDAKNICIGGIEAQLYLLLTLARDEGE